MNQNLQSANCLLPGAVFLGTFRAQFARQPDIQNIRIKLFTVIRREMRLETRHSQEYLQNQNRFGMAIALAVLA